MLFIQFIHKLSKQYFSLQLNFLISNYFCIQTSINYKFTANISISYFITVMSRLYTLKLIPLIGTNNNNISSNIKLLIFSINSLNFICTSLTQLLTNYHPKITNVQRPLSFGIILFPNSRNITSLNSYYVTNFNNILLLLLLSLLFIYSYKIYSYYTQCYNFIINIFNGS